MSRRKLILVSSLLACFFSNSVWAGASSAPATDVGAGKNIEKINKHAIKSALLLRQLLAQNGVATPSAK